MNTDERENEYFGTFVFKYRHTFYAERPDGKYKKINYRSSDDYVSDLKDVEEVLSEDIDKYATLGEDLYIPYGFYWFSYAHTEAEAIKEAKAFLEVIKPYKPEYPVAFDFEYKGYDYVKRVHNITLSKEQLTKNAKAFLKTLEQAGYYTINYSNLDYPNNRFTPEITSRFDL